MQSFVRTRRPAALVATAAILLTFAAPLAARGQDDTGAAGIGVARLNLIGGDVAVQRGDAASPTAAAVNAPVLGGDYVTTGDGGRAEIQFDDASAVRLGAGVQMRFTQLDTTRRELQLAAGTIDLRLLRGGDGTSQIDTPSVAVQPHGTGSYRVTVDADGTSLITVRSGSADIVSPNGHETLSAGTSLLARGDAANPTLQPIALVALDDFDGFNHDRDLREQRALADAAYLAPGVPGGDDLDQYGRWVNDGSYGHVWVPYTVATGWAPYRDGRWVWEDGYGWTWLGYEPWGWAPYHYGSWYHSPAYGWAWYPQPAYHAWRPAVVGFFTFGGGGLSIGFGNVGWVPLAPFEPYHPWWGPGYNRTTIVNVTNTSVTNNYYGGAPGGAAPVYRNLLVAGGATSVSRERFLQGRFGHPSAVAAAQIAAVRPVRGALPIVPTERNLLYSNRTVAPQLAVRPALLAPGHPFAGTAAPVTRRPFEQQRTEYAHAAKLPLAPLPAAHAPATAVAPPAGAATTQRVPDAAVTRTQHPVDPWSRFGNNGAQTLHSPERNATVARPATVRPAETVPAGTLHPAVVHAAPSVHPAATEHATKAVRHREEATPAPKPKPKAHKHE